MTKRIALHTLVGLAFTLGAANAANVPANLVGEWHSGGASTSGYENTVTGAWRSARSSSFTLRLAADGSYEYIGLMVVETAGCQSRMYNAEKGKATFNGAKLTLKPTSGDSQYSICGSNPKPGSLKASDWSWKLGKDSYGKETLFLGSVDGDSNPTSFYRVAKASAPQATATTKPAATPSASRTISGSVTAAGGHSLKNTVVIACPNGDCSSDDLKGVVIEATGSTASWVLRDLDDVPYAIYALQDNDRNEDVNAGDWVNRELLSDEDAALVKVGTQNVKLELVAVK